MADDRDMLASMQEASAFYRSRETLNAPRGPHSHETTGDHHAHEAKAAAHEAWYVSQDIAMGPDVAKLAADVASAGRAGVDPETIARGLLPHGTTERPRSKSRGPADVGSMPPLGAMHVRRGSER